MPSSSPRVVPSAVVPSSVVPSVVVPPPLVVPFVVPPLGSQAGPLPALAAPSDGAAPRWPSQVLLAGGREAAISHAGAVYRLRLTALGKLILTK